MRLAALSTRYAMGGKKPKTIGLIRCFILIGRCITEKKRWAVARRLAPILCTERDTDAQNHPEITAAKGFGATVAEIAQDRDADGRERG
jgi:hypothetical protein